ncbi:transposase [Streptomyces noursei ZPM]|uniref:Mutator family transposase n=1 Tax=Streptomyces noursei TaxID=1971 RepID=A0A401RAT7_STRNR|nr:IS256 family transposase [Streptomyces noursei]AKA06877.1 transposase [Streptomyces noursei ZPM]EOT05809.1 transposase [Streptomyces noursei CCRC 11814]EXU91966.1 transposase [Streptomyces noursei PD-1]UWS75413.1 IS256 family transposase [Streptomyces noursei]GCB94718.1 IS256 family transposase [Streptomyces noursei]
MTDKESPAAEPVEDKLVDEVVERLMDRADTSGTALLGEGGLLTEVTRAVLERALDAEMTEHLGYERHDPAGRGSGNSRNGTSPKTVLTDAGAVTVAVPRDRNGSFEPRLVPKHARRLAGFNEQILSLYARGMSVRDIRSHLAGCYSVEVSPDLISKVTDAVADELAAWQNRPLEAIWPIIYIDALWVKIRSGAVVSKPVYLAVGVDMDGCKDVLGLWVGDGGEGATTWMSVLTELRNRGVEDVCIVACDGLKGLPDAVTATWPKATVQTCVIHLVRASLRLAAKQHHAKLIPELKAIYTEQAAEQALAGFTASEWGQCYPAIVRTWQSAWSEFTPYLAFPPEIRKVVYSTNLIESINARLRKVTRNRGHFPSEEAALKVLYLAVRELIAPKGRDINHVAAHWKKALNQFSLFFEDRLNAK